MDLKTALSEIEKNGQSPHHINFLALEALLGPRLRKDYQMPVLNEILPLR